MRPLAKELWSPKLRRNVIKKFARAGYILCKNPDSRSGCGVSLASFPNTFVRRSRLPGKKTRRANDLCAQTIDGRESTLEERMALGEGAGDRRGAGWHRG